MKKLLCALCAMTLLATATGCSNNNADKDKKETSGNTLVVASNNIDAKSQPDVDAQRKLLEENGVEIFGLQEVDNMTRRNHYDAFFSNAIAFSGGEYGIATVSKYEFKSKDATKLYSDLFAGKEIAQELADAYKDYDPDNKESEAKMDAVSAKNPIEPRLYQRVVIEKDGKEIAFYNTHLSYEDQKLRKQQMETLMKAMDSDTCKYVIAVGDFNADQSTKEFDAFKEKYHIANGLDGKWLDTYNGVDDTMKVNSVDNIIVSKNITIKEVKMIPSKLSDHNPLVATLELGE